MSISTDRMANCVSPAEQTLYSRSYLYDFLADNTQRNTDHLHLLKTLFFACMYTRSSSSVYESTCEYMWIVRLHYILGIVIVTSYDKITAQTGRPILMSVFKMCFDK